MLCSFVSRGSRRSVTSMCRILMLLVVPASAMAQAVPPPGQPPARPSAAPQAQPPAQQKPSQKRQPAAPVSAIPEAGLWLDHTGRGAVEISACGPSLCGHIVWLKEPIDRQGRPLRDAKNEETGKRNRPICGLQVIGEVKPQRDGTWDEGWIYDPEQGEQFDLELRLRTADALQVKGYKGLKFLNETFQWKRIAELPSPRCTP